MWDEAQAQRLHLWKPGRRLIVLSALFISVMQKQPKAGHVVMRGNLERIFYFFCNVIKMHRLFMQA